jgi:hypothetical protein
MIGIEGKGDLTPTTVLGSLPERQLLVKNIAKLPLLGLSPAWAVVVDAAFAQHAFFVIVTAFAAIGAHIDHAAADHLVHVIDQIGHA